MRRATHRTLYANVICNVRARSSFVLARGTTGTIVADWRSRCGTVFFHPHCYTIVIIRISARTRFADPVKCFGARAFFILIGGAGRARRAFPVTCSVAWNTFETDVVNTPLSACHTRCILDCVAGQCFIFFIIARIARVAFPVGRCCA